MARIFNIYFTYRACTYNAIVTVRQTPFFTEYMLASPDDNIMNALPSNRIISRGHNHFTFVNAASGSEANILMTEIIKAVAAHMHATPL